MRPIMTMAVIIAFAATLAACGQRQKDETSGTSPHGDKPRIALIMKSLANEFFLTMEEGAREHEAAHADRYALYADGIKDELDVNRQIQLVEQMVARGVDAIVIAPADSKALIPACQRAMNAGVVVVNIDNKFDTEVLAERNLHIPFVGPDNRKGAHMAGAFLAERLEPESAVAIIEGVPTAYNGIQRRLGFEDAMNEAGMRIVASQAGDWEMAKANRVAAALLTEQPELKALLCANDNMALGAIAALRSAGKLGAVQVIGFDNISAARELLERGDLLATVDQHADQLAVFGIEFALSILEDGATPEDHETPVDLIASAGTR